MTETADPTAIGPFIVLRKLGEGAMGVVYAGFDVSLDRKVALKLVRRQLLDKPTVRARMIREAQAMARLSNPHVVQIYQVGEHAGGIYVAMEYIDGQTLDGWLHMRKRPWQAVLRTVCEAGRGLAAAHAAGLVHRDFKPDNVLVDTHDHARVLDFGLVQTEAGDAEDDLARTEEDAPVNATMPGHDGIDRSNIHWSVRLTQIGKVLGTPAYMSPEQHFGHLSGPYSDQFSFAVTLYEALYGTRPFVGDSWVSIKTQVESGVVPPPPPDSPVPRRLFKILVRALATAPEKRWPNLGEMLDALEHDPQRARVRVAAMVGLLGIASAGSYAVAIARAPELDRCEAGVKEMASVWGDERRAAVARAFASTGTPFATDVLQRVEERLDSYARTWAAEHRLACESNASGLETARLMDLRFACLGRRKVHMQALVDVFAQASGEVVENAVQAVAALPGVQACADADVLLAAVAPPGDAGTVAKVDALRERLARGAALEATGGYAEGLKVVQAARAEAIAVGYGPLTAEAALAEGGLLWNSGRPNEADAALSEAVRLGVAHDMHAVAAEAAARRIFVVGVGLREHQTALASQLFAEALVERANDDGRLEALLQNNLGAVFDLHGDDAAARIHFQRTIELLRSSGDPDPLLAVVYHNLANIDLERGDLEAAEENSTRAHALFIALLGQRHPLVAHPLAGLGDVALKRGKLDNLVIAEKHYREALALMEAGHGLEHPYLLHPLTGLGRVAARQGDAAGARRRFDRVVAIAERNEYMHPLLGEALEELGELTAADGDETKALASFERAVQVYGEDHKLQASAITRAGAMVSKFKDPAPAIAWFERIVASQPGPMTGAPTRLAAALALAPLYAGSDRAGPVCEQLREVEAALPVVDDRRERVATALKSCAPR